MAAESNRLVDVMDVVLAQLGLTLLMVAGDDRRTSSARTHVHFLCGRPTTHELLHLEVAVSGEAPAIPTLAALSFPASRFEREMRDLLGITPIGHPDPRPLVRHGSWPADFHPLRDGGTLPALADQGQPFPFTPVQGDGVYEIPVGPVHAGVIEPGHFRFNVLGETILKMRARLYYTHKGTEKRFIEDIGPPDEYVYKHRGRTDDIGGRRAVLDLESFVVLLIVLIAAAALAWQGWLSMDGATVKVPAAAAVGDGDE